MRPNPWFVLGLLALVGMAGAPFLIRGNVGEHEVEAAEMAPTAEEKAGGSGGPPPLVIDREAPLLLDERAETGESGSEPTPQAVADNSACFVCHANYEDEPLAHQHARAGIGCVDCHGESHPHRNDENNITPPDIMYPAERIDPSCRECHATHDVPATEVIALWLNRCSAKKDPKNILCTDCHGEHRLKVRTVRWDKKTRKLITENKSGGRRKTADEPQTHER